VAADDSWKIPAEAVKALLAPGGDLKLRPEGDMQEMTGMEQFSPSDIVGSLEGEFQAVYSGVREEGGKRVGVVKLKVEAQSAQDLSDKASEMSEKMAESLPVKMNITAFDGEFKYDSEGELLWDLETGLPHSLSLSGEMRMILDISMSVETPDGEQSMEQSLTFAGTQTIALATGGD